MKQNKADEYDVLSCKERLPRYSKQWFWVFTVYSSRSKAIFRSMLSIIFCILLWLVWLINAHFGYGLKDLLPLPKLCSCLWMWELMTSLVGQGIWISITCDNRHFRVRAQNTCNGWLRDNVWPEMVTLKLTSQKLHSLVILTVTHALSRLKNSQILTCNSILDSAKSHLWIIDFVFLFKKYMYIDFHFLQ